MKIAAVQMVSTPSVERNLDAARAADRAAPPPRARGWSSCPSTSASWAGATATSSAIAEAPGDGPIQRMLAEAAREHGVWLIGGTLPLAERRRRAGR